MEQDWWTARNLVTMIIHGFDGGRRCGKDVYTYTHDFCSKTRRISGKTMQVPLNRAEAPMSNWQLGMAPGWLCFQLV